MNRKIFQLFFVLIIITAFAVIIKGYVDNIVSDYNDFKTIISQAPNSEISRLSPIVIKLTKDIDTDKFPLNTPLETNIIHSKPEIEGYTYFTNNRTIEFQPNEPLLPSQEYSIKFYIERLFPGLKFKTYHYLLHTPKLAYKVNFGDIEYFDTVTNTQNPIIKGEITFNDFVAYEQKQQILQASQGTKELPITYFPGKDDHRISFSIKGIKRKEKNDRLKIIWNGESINSSIKDSTHIELIATNKFEVVNAHITYLPEPLAKITFTNLVNKTNFIDTLIRINNKPLKEVKINNNELIIPIKFDTLKHQEINISKLLQDTNKTQLANDFNFEVKQIANNTLIELCEKKHYLNKTETQNLLEIDALNLKKVSLEIIHVPDKNMMQFLQVNDLNENNEIERVGTKVFTKTYQLSNHSNFNPQSIARYNLDMLGIDFSKKGLFNFKFDYDTADIYFKQRADFNNKREYNHNVIFSEIFAVAKLTSSDSLYLFVNNLTSNAPVKNATIEIFNFQQNKIATLLSNPNGVAKTKVEGNKFLIRVTHENEISYLKITPGNSQLTINNKGIITQNGYLCHIEGLKAKYKPGDSIKVISVCKKNGEPDKLMQHYEIKLIDPEKQVFNTYYFENTGSNIFKYTSSIPNNASPGNWLIQITNDETSFTFPFNVDNKINLTLPVKINLDKKRNVINVISTGKHSQFVALPIEITINNLENTIAKKYPQYHFGKSDHNNSLTSFVKKTRLDKNGKVKIKLPEWISKSKGFSIKTSYTINNNTVFVSDTLIITEPNISIIGLDASFNDLNNLEIDILEFNPAKIKNSALLEMNLKLFAFDANTSNSVKIIDSTLHYSGLKHITILNKKIKSRDIIVSAQNKYCASELKIIIPKEKKRADLTLPFTVLNEKINCGGSLSVIFNPAIKTSGLLTIENGQQVFYSKWMDTRKSRSISIEVTEAMIPGAYISFNQTLNENSSNFLKYFYVLNPAKEQVQNIIADIPYDWSPNNVIQSTITNPNKTPLKYIYSVYQVADTFIENNIDLLFKQQQFNTTKNYSSLNNKPGNFTSYSDTSKYLNQLINHKSLLMVKGPFTLNANEAQTLNIKTPFTDGKLLNHIIAFDTETGTILETNYFSQIYEPINIISDHPQYVNFGDIIAFYISIENKSSVSDSLIINLNHIENLDILSSVTTKGYIRNNSDIKILIKARAKKANSFGQIEINAKLGAFKAIKQITFPIKVNPNNLTNYESMILDPGKQWQKKVNPIGLQGTNKAVFEFANHNIPPFKQIINQLTENRSIDILTLTNKTLPLISYSKIVSNNEQLNNYTNTINDALLTFISRQNQSGGFANNITDSIWLTSYIGHFALLANKNGFEINPAFLNKWIRYQKITLHRLKANLNDGDINFFYVLYTLVLSNAIDFKTFEKFSYHQTNNITNKLLMANCYLHLGKNRLAQQIIDIENLINQSDTLTLLDNALLLDIISNLNKLPQELSLIKQINKRVKLNQNKPYEVSLALHGILNVLLKKHITNFKFEFQVNNGKLNIFNSQSKVSYIEIPLEFTLTKNLDFNNIGNDTLFINYWSAGHPQKVSNYTNSINKLNVNNTYYYVNGEVIESNKLSSDSYFTQTINYKNTSNKVSQNLAVSIPIPAGLSLMYYAINNRQYFKFNDNEFINFDLVLQPGAASKIKLFYQCKFPGEFNSYPIKTLNKNALHQIVFTPQKNININ